MKKLIPLLSVAIIANALIVLIFNYSNGVPSEDVPFYDNIISIIAGVGIITNIVLTIIYRKDLFKKLLAGVCAVILILLTTPLPFILAYRLMHPMPEKILVQSNYWYPPGKVHKWEHWEYSWGSQVYVEKSLWPIRRNLPRTMRRPLNPTVSGFTLKEMATL